jgi:Cu/Ag efflux protein CusF
MAKHVLAICVLVCTGMVGAVVAQEKPNEQKKPEQAPAAAAKIQTGEVASIDAAKNEIVIKDEAGAEIHLLVGTSTKITKAGKEASLGDLKVGDKVSTECEESTDGCKAKSISVIPPAEHK